MADPYGPHRAFVRPALRSTSIGLVLIIAAAMELAFLATPDITRLLVPAHLRDAYDLGDTPLGVIAQLASFACIALTLVVLVRKLHKRGFWSMVGPVAPTLRHMKIAGIAVFWVLLAQEFLPPWIVMSELAMTRDILGWAIWIIPALAVLVIQCGTEELYFRGYLQQQCAAISDKRWVWMGLPSVLFGVGHYLSGFGPVDGVLYAFWATLLGLACADLTARTGNIGAATGLHVSNNLFAFVVIGDLDGPSSGLALFLYPPFDDSQIDQGFHMLTAPFVLQEAVILTLMVAVMWLSARIAIQR